MSPTSKITFVKPRALAFRSTSSSSLPSQINADHTATAAHSYLASAGNFGNANELEFASGGSVFASELPDRLTVESFPWLGGLNWYGIGVYVPCDRGSC